jgi:hypothetical protein
MISILETEAMKNAIRLMGLLSALAIAGCARDVRADNSTTPATGNSTPAAAAVSRVTSAKAPAPAAEPEYREVVIPAGTKLGVRLNTGVGSKTSHAEEAVDATLISPLRIGGKQVLAAGSHVKGIVTAAQPAGKVKGRARIAVRFTTLTANGENYPIAAAVSRIAPATKGEDAAKIGIPAAGGAVIGGLVGGGKGAAIGAAAGGGAGAAVVLSTPGKEVSLPKGSVLALRLQKSVTVKVPVKANS